MVTGGDVRRCSSRLRVPHGKYFLGVTRVRAVTVSPAKAYLSSFCHCSGVCLHDTFHISNKKKKDRKMEKRRVCLNSERRRYAALHRVAGRGAR